MRFLFTSWPAWGHLYPMYPLARAAQEAGHEVTFASGEDVVPGLQRDGFPTWSVGPTREQAAAARDTAQQPSHARPWDQRVLADVSDMFAPASAQRAAAMLPLVEAHRPDLVIHGAGDAAGPAVAAVLGRPSVLHGLSPLPPGFERLLAPLTAVVEDRFGLAGLHRRVFGGPVLDLTPASLRPPGSEEPPNRQPLRPSVGEVDPDPDVAGAIAALPFGRTVYLTLGTIANDTPGVMEAVLAGVLDCGVNVVVTTGPGFDPSRLGQPPAHVLIREHIGQATVLRSCCVVISHAGAGTMLGALGHGLPQLALPMAADQPYNAAILERVGAGLRLDPTDVTAEAIRDGLTRLLDETSFTAAARRVHHDIASMPSAREVLDLIVTRVLTQAG